MILDYFEYLFYVALVLGILPILIWKSGSAKNNPALRPIRLFLWLLLIGSIQEFAGRLYYHYTRDPDYTTAYWFRIYNIAEFFTLYYYFNTIVKGRLKFFFYSYLMLFVALNIYFLTIWDTGSVFVTEAYITILITVFTVSCSILWFRNKFIDLPEESLLQLPDFYFIAGFIIYFPGSVFLFLVSDFLLKKMPLEMPAFWLVMVVINLIMRSLMSVGILIARKKQLKVKDSF